MSTLDFKYVGATATTFRKRQGYFSKVMQSDGNICIVYKNKQYVLERRYSKIPVETITLTTFRKRLSFFFKEADTNNICLTSKGKIFEFFLYGRGY